MGTNNHLFLADSLENHKNAMVKEGKTLAPYTLSKEQYEMVINALRFCAPQEIPPANFQWLAHPDMKNSQVF